MKRILIVDSSPAIRRVIRKDLEKGDFEIFEAGDSEAALALIPDIEPDIIILDIDMPPQNGYEVCAAIRSMKPQSKEGKDLSGIPVIFITVNDALEERTNGFLAGGTDFITRPFVSGEVLQAVQRLLTPNNNLSNLTALIVDDNLMARKVIKKALEPQGLEMIEAEDGMEALGIIMENPARIDIVVTDYSMPVMNGEQLCVAIRKEMGLKDIPIIFLTALSEKKEILKFFKIGASDYLIKPFAKEELVARIRVHVREKSLNDQLREKIKELRHLHKLKDDFLAIASHDLRSPLTGILGFSELLLEGPDTQEDLEFYIKSIQESGIFLLDLMNDLLDISRLQSDNDEFEKTPVNLYEVITSCITTMTHMASPKSIQIHFENQFPQTKMMINGDKNRLFRVMNNLLSNAIKFTSQKGKISILVKPQKENLFLSIQDNGVGISKKNLPHIFDQFSKASQQGTEGEKSTGLGMSITKDLVEKHDGNISVTSEVGKGTTFELLFPLLPS